MGNRAKPKFYAVAKGRRPGIYLTWPECEAQVNGVAARFKGFATREEAEDFVASGGKPELDSKVSVDSSKSGASTMAKQGRSTVLKGTKNHAQQSIYDDIASGPDQSFLASDHPDQAAIAAAATKHSPRKYEPKAISYSLSSPYRGKRKATDEIYVAERGMAKERKSDIQAQGNVRIIEAYTDGASSSNGKVGAKAGWGVHWPDALNNPSSDLAGLDESARLPGELQTNNRAELMALVRACQLCPDRDAQLRIYTDSSYSINCITKWQEKWRKNKWKITRYTHDAQGKSIRQEQDVMNQDLIRRLEYEMTRFRHRPELIYVKGHSTSKGNKMADQLAVAGAKLPAIPRSEQLDSLQPPESGDVKKERAVAPAIWKTAGFTRKHTGVA